MADTSQLATLLLLGLVLAVGGGYAALREGQIYLAEGRTSIRTVASLAASATPVSISYHGQRATLQDCELVTRSMNTVEMRRLPTDMPAQLLQYCAGIADTITDWVPTDAFAWQVGAQAAARQSEMGAATVKYVKAVETAPNEQWIAQYRVNFAEDNLQSLSPEARELHQADLRMLAESHRGIVFLAALYARRVDARERITQAIESASPKFQAIFLYNLRTQISGSKAQ